MDKIQERKMNFEKTSEQRINIKKHSDFLNIFFIYAMVGDVGLEPTTR